MKQLLASILLLCGISISQDSSPLVFQPDPLPLGTVEQGVVKHIVLNGKNLGKTAISLETAMSQSVGGSGYRYPSQIPAGASFKIEFDLNTANLEGPFTHRVVLVEKGGKPHVALVEGRVESPILFSQQILDAGYLEPGAQPKWTIYAYHAKGAKFTLALDSEAAKSFTMTSSPVLLNTERFDEIKEGGTVPGLKIALTYSNPGNGPTNPKIRSVRQIVNMKSPTWPNATPSLFVVGFWKEK